MTVAPDMRRIMAGVLAMISAATLMAVVVGARAPQGAVAPPGAETASAAATKQTIWDGVFTEAQATRGQQGYKQACARCHSNDLLGDAGAPPLVGEALLSRYDGTTVDNMVQAIRASMPQEAPDSLGAAVYIDIVSYLLKSSGGRVGPIELPVERERLQEIVISIREPGR